MGHLKGVEPNKWGQRINGVEPIFSSMTNANQEGVNNEKFGSTPFIKSVRPLLNMGSVDAG
jgi:hypothetical protein